MAWQFTWTPRRERFLRKVNPVAETLTKKPVLDPRLTLFWEAFVELSASRPSAFDGVANIPIADVAAYCQLCGFDDPTFRHELLTMVQAMDRKWVELVRKYRPSRTGSDME